MRHHWLKTLPLLLTVLLLTACRSHDEAYDHEAPTRDIMQCFNAEGKAWLNVSLSLPAIKDATRASGSFDDGDGKEWAVKTLTFVFFSGDSEADATVASTVNYDVPSSMAAPFTDVTSPTTDGTNNQITATLQFTSDNINPGDNVYLLVVLNAPADFTVSNGDGLSSLTQSALTCTIDDTEYFTMTNSPLATGSSITTLPKINTSMIFASEDDAKNSPAAIVNVERAAAKVTVKSIIDADKHHILGNSTIDFTDGDLKFSLDNFNTSYYLCRQFNKAWLSYDTRFWESTAVSTGQYRTYWAKDKNYDGKTDLVATTSPTLPQTPASPTAAPAEANWLTFNSNDYCAENTFDVAYMQDDCTTSVLIRLQLNGKKDFYTTSITGSDVIYQEPAPSLTEEGTSASESFAPRRSTTVTTAKPIDEYLRQWLWTTSSDFRDWVRNYAAGEMRHVKIEVTGNADTGLATVSSVTQTARESGDGVSAFTALGLADYINNNMTIRYYENGFCYYRVPIRHFTDTETPWSSAASMTGNTPSVVYVDGDGKTAEERYLGRYGVVRNTWYTISIDGVSHVGSPIIPALTTAADDTVEQLLNATLTVSGWEGNSQTIN